MSQDAPCLGIKSMRKIESVALYETQHRFVLVGCLDDKYRIVKIDRDPFHVNLTEDQHWYTKQELDSTLSTMQARKTVSGVGVLGFVRFVQGWYLLLIVAKKQIGLVGTHKIFVIDDSTVVQLGSLSREEHELTRADEARYKSLFFGIDLSSFYFSFTYNMTRTLQSNMCQSHDERVDEKFCWNWYLSAPVRHQLSPQWFLPIIQGYAGSRTYAFHLDHAIRFTLISRRSQYYAGTRYLKRGVCDSGSVANDVETEQIVQELRPVTERVRPHLSSFVQTRGSIPLFWSQENTFAVPKPDVVVYRGDPFHNAAILHFQDVFSRYGSPVIILNLVKHHEKRPRETILLNGFTEAVETVNVSLPPDHQLVYIAWDFHAHTKKEELAGSLVPIVRESVRRTGFFHTGILNGQHLQRTEVQGDVSDEQGNILRDWKGLNAIHLRGQAQRGVMRSNCVDCLDRTNAAQFCVGVAALGEQLFAMGLTASALLEYRSNLVSMVLAMYEEMGDAIAVQYAGSLLAHRMNSYAKSNTNKTPASRWSAVSKDLMTSIRRYYTSTFTDAEKQSSINLFLGRFRPYEQPAYEPLWSLPSDAALHMPPESVHKRPLWTTQWWDVPLAKFEESIRWFQDSKLLLKPAKDPMTFVPPPRQVIREEDYRHDVSDVFIKAYHPNMITFFDEMLAKPFLQVYRASELQVVVNRENYMSTLSSWLQGDWKPKTSKSPLPHIRKSPIHQKTDENKDDSNVPQEATWDKSPVAPTKMNKVSLEKYGQYVDFADQGVWDQKLGERRRLEVYLEKCFDTSVVSMSPDFLPSQAYYSGYLMDSETFSFEPALDSIKLYEELAEVPQGIVETYVPIDSVAQDEYSALLFANNKRE